MKLVKAFDGKNIVFIAGCPRSGTTYLQKLLAAMPGVQTGQESHLFYLVEPLWKRWQAQVKAVESDARGGVGMPVYFDEWQFEKIVRDFLGALFAPMLSSLQSGEIFLEKTPSNALYVKTIHQLLPQAKIIFLQRDARAVVASMLAASRTWGKNWAPSTASQAARSWRDHSETAFHEGCRLPSSLFYSLKYEELIAGPLESLCDLSFFLQQSWGEKELKDSIEKNSLGKARRSGGTQLMVSGEGQDINEPEGFVRKGKSDSWKRDLTFFEKLLVWRITRSTMKKLGYKYSHPW